VKAFLLAAGSGTRLMPLTADRPKPMMPVAGRPILEHTIRRLVRFGITDLVINLHHAPDAVPAHFGDGTAFGARITYSHEPELLGTAGALAPWRRFFSDAPFFVVYGDNLSTCRYDALWRAHTASQADATVALFWREDPTASGIADVGDDGLIRRFVEKPRPDEVFSHWVNAGIFALDPILLRDIPDAVADFGRDLLPQWIASDRRVAAYRLTNGEGLWWADTPADLARIGHDLEGRTDL
jgi:mannose-1-phosphate guanylyltransferase